MRKTLIAIFAAITALTGCGDDKPPPPQSFNIVLTRNPSVADQARLKAGLNAFMTACEPLFRKYWGDIVKAEAYMGDPTMNYTGQRYGWTREIWVEVDVAERPRAIPNQWEAWGHKLMWVAGAGAQPGLIAKKDQAALVCGMKPSGNGSDVFQPNNGFQVLAAPHTAP